MTSYRLIWHSRVTARTYTGATLYATREAAQLDADFCDERYHDIGMSYSVEPVDEPTADSAAEPVTGRAILDLSAVSGPAKRAA